ncbi:hypothetical protein [Clostridium butyricum]
MIIQSCYERKKLTSLESKKNALLIRIDEAEREAILTSPSKEMIKNIYLKIAI